MNDPNGIRAIAQAGKDRDPAWYRVHRRFSIHISAALLRTPVKLDHVTYSMMLMGLLAAALLLSPSLWLNALGVAAGYASFLLDKVDGEIARVRGLQSVRGILLDRFHHRLVEPLIFLAVGVRAWQATDSLVPVIAAFATMLAANIIEETQQLPPFIAAKHARETRAWPVSARVPTAAVERMAAVMRSLKTFRMYLTVLPLVLMAILAEAWTGRSITTAWLVVSAIALWVYTLFQAWYYANGQLDAEIAQLERQLPPLPPAASLPAEPRVAPAADAAADGTAPSRGVRSSGIAAVGLLLLAVASGPAAAVNYYVDINNPASTPAGPGTSLQPYSTISAAVAARGAPGNTILVRPGVYREQVSIVTSGTSTAPFVVRATASGVIVDGADDYSLASQWVISTGTVYLASSVTWAPKQVIVGGVRLIAATGSPPAMPVNTFLYVPGQGLYVNLGGANPGQSQTLVGRRNNNFTISGQSWVTIDGFDLVRAEDRGISITSNSTDVQVTDNTQSLSARFGIYVNNSHRVRIANNRTSDNLNHGIVLTSGASNCTIEDNESFLNALPGTRVANGLYAFGASSNVIRRNKWHDNQDTGLHLQSGSNDNVSYNNISWNNGDHGYDHLGALNTLHLNDVAYGNHMDGFSIEGASTGTRLFNCISAENGLTTNEYDLWVDAGSLAGFQANDNLYWNAGTQAPIKIASTPYATLAAYVAATGHDTRSLQADPRFFLPSGGDFRIQSDSPVIDNGNSSDPNWPATDRNGRQRFDIAGIPNAGQGPVSYSDRGAHEYRSTGLTPVAALTATPSSGMEPLEVTLNASGSRDPDGTIVAYRFDFGDGAKVGPQAGSSASHTYAGGTFQASVTVTDNSGKIHTRTITVSVTPRPDIAPNVSSPATGLVAENSLLTLNVTASDPDGDAITSLTADLSGLPAGHNAVFTPGTGNTTGALAWTPSFAHAGVYTVRFIAANAKSDTASAVISVTNTDRAPVVVAPASLTITAGMPGAVSVTASDPDGDPIGSLTADLSGLPSGHTAVFTPGPGNTSGVLSWTPSAEGAGTYPVSFMGTNASTGLHTTQLSVALHNMPPTVSFAATPSSGVAPLNVSFSGAGSSDPEGGSLTYKFEFGDGVVIGPQSQATASHLYSKGTFTAKLTVTDAAGASSSATTVIVASLGVLGPNLVANNSFESGLAGWAPYSGATLARVAGGHDGAWAAQLTGPATTASFGINDSPNWVVNAGAFGTRYHFTAWVRSDTSRGSAKIQIREYLGATKVGATVFSPAVTLSPTWQMLTADFTTAGIGTTLDLQVYESPLFPNEGFLVDAVAIQMVTVSGGPPVVVNNESDSRTGPGETLVFGARMVPSIMSTNATLQFTTTRRGAVRVDLFDAAGRRVREVLDEPDMGPGMHALNIDGRSDRGDRLSSGVYFYRVQATERSAVGRLVIAH